MSHGLGREGDNMKQWIFILIASLLCVTAFARDHYPYGQNQLSFGYSNTSVANIKIPTPPSPLFWSARQNANEGAMIRFSHIFYGRKFFSLGLGLSASNWKIPDRSLWALSAYLEMRLWLFINPEFRAYLLYSIAGPTELTHRRFGVAYFSENFLFQDYLGAGIQIGRQQAFDIEAYTVHYSNGDIFTLNSGIQVPFMLSIGYNFK